ncbi:hypothetical protein [Enterococcus casseliflavus]|jgi:hypothetical protein|uniref:hypothetical protein n=1 Tax=Enterococcus casseliflavus TaxID=37734 RepID=UPI00325BD5E0
MNEKFFEELITFRNELKSRKPSRYKLIGISSELILSKDVFDKNIDIEKFIAYVFEEQFKQYLFASRTNLVARTTRLIIRSNDEQYLSYKKRLSDFLNDIINHNENNIRKNTFDSWL